MKHILIVEDDPMIRTMLQESLQLEGFATSVAQDGEKALHSCNSKVPDAVVTDILMPEKEGLTLIKELRKIYKDMVIVAISGGAKQLSPSCNLELAEMFGASKTFSKPLDIDILLSYLREALG